MNERLKNLEPQLAWLFLLVTFVLVITLAGTAQTKDADTEGPGEQVQNPVATEVQNPAETETASAEVHRTSGRHFKLAWDNTLKYSNAFRVKDRNPLLVDATASGNSFIVNQDDGDRNFHRGLISNRADLLTEMDLTYGSWGVRASGAAWNDQSYNQRNANNSPYTTNNLTTNYNHFTQSARDTHFRNAELLDAFAFGTVHVANGEMSVRGGQFAQIWGETLFFGNNGIAGGMAPIDIVKALSVPFTQFKELVRPVPQVSLSYSGAKMSIAAYYQLAWEADRFPADGSYFANIDLGGECILAAPLPVINPVTGLPIWGVFTQVPSPGIKNSGQGGVQFRLLPGRGWEFALYAIQFHEKAPQTSYLTLGTGAPIPVGLPTNPMLQIGSYYLVYPENVQSYGFGASKTRGFVNYAVELSGRTHMDLVSNGQTILPGHGMVIGPNGPIVTADNNNNPLYAVGSSIHGNASVIVNFTPNVVAKEASMMAEIGWNRLVSISNNPGALDPGVTRDAVGWQVTYTPTYRQVRQGLDLSPNVGWSFYPMGKSAVIVAFGPDKGGSVSAGLSATYRNTWVSGLSYNHYYGPVGPALHSDGTYTYKQSLADRDFIAFSIYRTFGVRAESGRSK